MIIIENVTKKYGKKTALNEINCTFNNGITALLGPNGAGKSTLMSLLTMNSKPLSGSIKYNDINIYENSNQYLSQISYMPQMQSLYPEFTGYEFLNYVCLLRGIKSNKAEVNNLINKLDLNDFVYKKIKSYSGGMKQRLLFASCLLESNKIIFLDEPTAGLDPIQRINFKNILSELSLSSIIVIATHIVQDIEDIAENVVMIKDGKIIKQSSINNFMNDFNDYFYELEIEANKINYYKNNYLVTTLRKQKDKVLVRFISKTKLDNYLSSTITLEDYYIWRNNK